jgi:hypothetical protein
MIHHTRWTFTMVTDARDKHLASAFTLAAENKRLRAQLEQWRFLAWSATFGFAMSVVCTLIYGAGWCK